METKKKIVFLICLAIFIGLTIFIVCNISENYTCSDSCKIIKYVAGQTNQSNTLTNISNADSESCVVSPYQKSNVVPFSTNGFEIKLNKDKDTGNLRSGRVSSVDTYKGDMMFIIDIASMTSSDIAYYAIWLYSNQIGEIDLMETANKNSSEFSYSLIKLNKNNQRISTQCEDNGYGSTSFKNDKYNHDHTLVFIKKGSDVTVYMNPIIKESENGGIPTIVYTEGSPYVRNYDLDIEYWTINDDNFKEPKSKHNFKELKDAEWKLTFNLEARHFQTKPPYSFIYDCKNKVYTENNQTASFKVGEVKYYDLTGKPNPASPSSGPTPNCCISKGKDACQYNGCNSFIKCKNTSPDEFKNNCCSKNAELVHEDNRWFYKCS